MKNIHILPTDKPSKLYLGDNGNFVFGLTQSSIKSKNNDFTNQNIYITNSEEIKEGDWFYCFQNNNVLKCFKKEEQLLNGYHTVYKKIVLTTDRDLIKDGVQAIDDEFLEWFVTNPIDYIDVRRVIKEYVDDQDAYGYDVDYYKIIIPKEESTMVDKLKEYFNNTSKEQIQKDWDETCKQTEGIISPTINEFLKAQEQFNKQETLEEAAIRLVPNRTLKSPFGTPYEITPNRERNTFIKGAKWQQERSYSEEEVFKLVQDIVNEIEVRKQNIISNSEKMEIHLLEGGCMAFESSQDVVKEWFEQFKKK